MVAWFLRLEDVLSWLLVEGKHNEIIIDINAIALFRQAIGSSPGRNDGTTILSLVVESMLVVVVNLEGYHIDFEKLMNEFVEELMIAVVDTKQNVTEFDG
ncbi:hypothetical protein Tco_0355031 [Tanacetum coccineum]